MAAKEIRDLVKLGVVKWKESCEMTCYYLIIGCLFIVIPNFWDVLEYTALAQSPPSAHAIVKIIAHRGASAYAPENTLVAFKKAIDLGATMLELDVHQTNDSHLVVIHDETVDRTTNGEGNIKDLSLAQIKLLDAGSWFSPEYAGEKIPTLGEVFDITPDSISLLIELKEGSIEYPGIEERVVQMIHKRDAQHRVILKSFDDDILKRLRKLAPDVRRLKVFVTQISFLGIIIERGLNFGTVLNDSVQYVQHHWFGLTQSFIDEAHRKGYQVFAWDVNDLDRMKDLVEIGIDGIETDHPDWVKELLH